MFVKGLEECLAHHTRYKSVLNEWINEVINEWINMKQ